jgi:hypothetical protein
MALSDVSQRCKAMSGLGATADIGRRYGLDGSVAFDPTETLAGKFAVMHNAVFPVTVW